MLDKLKPETVKIIRNKNPKFMDTLMYLLVNSESFNEALKDMMSHYRYTDSTTEIGEYKIHIEPEDRIHWE